MSLLAAGCGGKSDTSSTGTATTLTPKGSSSMASLTGSLTGGGSSFQDGFDQRAIADFSKVAPKANVVYQKSGSSDGKKALADGTVDFAGSDSLIKPEETLNAKKADVLYFPTVVAPITVSYNVKGVTDLRLSGDTVAKIFAAKITTWNDPAIKADNPGTTLPSTSITVVHRSDGSGTTSNFTKYLVAAAPGSWTLGSGDSVQWPASTQGAEKNSGVATVISQTDGAIGYVDLADAAKSNLDVAAIKNKAGKFVKPTPAGASAAAAGATVAADLTYNPIDASGDAAYPITSPTYVLVYKTQTDPAKAKLLKAFIRFMLTDEQAVAGNVLYAPLPKSLAAKAVSQLDQIGT
ncbi:MAG: phosphate ABC transporter substrate-binding protein PstS [Actinobacteria bacterium]|nr:phosphate ABC transporter substrate-binding protein PstS [Actinomycetota bacterium]